MAEYEIPVLYNYANTYNAKFSPSTIHARNTGLARYYQRYLLQKAISVFKWNFPDNWSKDYFLYTLYCHGYIGIVETDKFGVIPQGGSLYGYDVFYQPTNIIITNPLLRGILKPRIGTDCAVIKLQPDFGGIMDIVAYYADMMAICSEAVAVNIMNSKLSYVFCAKNKPQAESYKKMFDNVASGELAVVIDKELFDDEGKPQWQPFNQNVKESYIASDILSDMRKIEAMFDTDIGIPSANTDKKERLITDEVNANNIETASKCEIWLETIKKGIAVANDLFGQTLSVDWRVDPKTDIVDGWNGGGKE
jgi:hypothetical protein